LTIVSASVASHTCAFGTARSREENIEYWTGNNECWSF